MTPSEQAKTEAQEGFYWVKYYEGWEPAKCEQLFENKIWLLLGRDLWVTEKDLTAIGPRILPPDANQ
jgi:hypothetical protein